MRDIFKLVGVTKRLTIFWWFNSIRDEVTLFDSVYRSENASSREVKFL